MLAGKPDSEALIAQTLSELRSWAERPAASDLATLPAAPAVYLLITSANIPVQLGTTQNLRRLVLARLADSAAKRPGRPDLAEVVRGVRWRLAHSAFEAGWWYYRIAREMYPKRYRRMISFGPAWFLEVDWSQAIPELRVTDAAWNAPGERIGPWLTQSTCRQALEGLWDLFDLCRYPEQVRKAPHGVRCAYADMGRCDAPCDGSAALLDYVMRCRAAWNFARGETRPWIDAAAKRMKAAAAAQQYELAGLLKRQVAWAWKWHDHIRPRVRPVEQFNYALAVPAPRRKAWRLFLFRRGELAEGPVITDRKLPKEAPEWLAGELARPPEDSDAHIRTEQTWLVAHFLNSKGGDASLIEALPELRLPEGWAERLAATIAERRSKAPEAGGPAEGVAERSSAEEDAGPGLAEPHPNSDAAGVAENGTATP